MRRGNTRQVTLMHRNARPGEAVHEIHRRIVVEIGMMPAVLLDDAEEAGWRRMARSAGGNRRLRDAMTVAVQDHLLLANGNNELKRAGRQFAKPESLSLGGGILEPAA